MTMMTTGERLWFGLGPTPEALAEEGSVWHVREEFLEPYLEAARAVDRRKFAEVEGLVKGGLAGNKTISSSWLLGLRAEARNAAGLDPIPLDRLGDFRVTEGWPSELASSDGIVAWALHQSCAEEALSVAAGRPMQEALEAARNAVRCPSCSVPVPGASSVLCSSCRSVLELVVKPRRAEELARERVEGRTTRLELLERWLATQ